ncbi:TetR/AcrR family transcriptional regulator [Hyphobacterium sp.]|uniref:TetR/AcrR family transcriptional regulator n=1 Tax=Hyphobacterium sp. TaxID=2004662 RepID=UPI003BAA96FB
MSENRWISDLHWRRDSQQSRGERTQNALLDAAENLIVEKGLDGATVAEIARRAGSSIGSFYHHFKDRKALFYAVFHRMTRSIEDLNQQVADDERWKDASLRDLLEGFIELRLHQLRAGGASKLAAALVMANHPELKSHMADIKRTANLKLLTMILDRKAEIGHPDPEFAARFVIDQLSAIFYARSDPYQRQSAIAECDDGVFKAEVLKLATSLLGLRRDR